MKRYFELIGANQCALIDIVDGAKLETAPVEDFSRYFKCEVQEISRQKYQALCKKYKEEKTC